MPLAAFGHHAVVDSLLQPLFAHPPSPGEMRVLLLIFFGPFILAGVLLLAAIVVCFWNRLAAGICLFCALVFFLIGYSIWWNDQRPVRERHTRWAAEVAENPAKLSSSDANDDDIRLLTNSSRLKNLNVRYCCLSNDAMVYIGRLTQLESLDIGESQIDDTGLEHIEPLTQLRHLSLYSLYGVTDQGLRHLRPLTQLETLNLWLCYSITDAGLESLKPMRQLRELDLGGCHKLTDAGLIHLEGLSELRWLNLTETKITDAGIEHLARLVNLRALSVHATQVTEGGVKKLQRSLPNCKIYYKDDYWKIDSDKEQGD